MAVYVVAQIARECSEGNWRNAVKTTGHICTKCNGSWKEHWQNISGLPWPGRVSKKCSVKDCDNIAEVGAHVRQNVGAHVRQNVGENFIAPLCQPCNKAIPIFSLKEDTVLVPTEHYIQN